MLNDHKFKWLKQRLSGCHADMTLMNKIVEFVLYDNPIDIEKLRKSLHHQVRLLALSFALFQNYLSK